MKKEEKPILMVALGGNALIKKGQEGTIHEQFENLRVPLGQVARLSESYRIIITHGNGPQVGNLLLQQECCPKVPKLPLEILVAQTEGQIGYMIESTLDSEMMRQGLEPKHLVSLITYVVVDRDDEAFSRPEKPIGPAYSREEAASMPWPTVKTAKGYRRVVASPRPLTVVEKREIARLIEMDFIVICCGGGGIPVIREERAFSGVDAVIDKDLASLCLADEVGVDVFVIATDVEGVFLDFGEKGQRLLSELTVRDAAVFIEEGRFPEGSMLPKVQAAMHFVRHEGKRAVITSVDRVKEAALGNAGTEFRR